MSGPNGVEHGTRGEHSGHFHPLHNPLARTQILKHGPANLSEKQKTQFGLQVDRVYDQAGSFIYTVDDELNVENMSYDVLRGKLRDITKPVYDLVNPRLRSENPEFGFNSHNLEDHIETVADFADQICKERFLPEHLRKLVLLAVYGHDLGNINSRRNHSHDSTVLFPHIVPGLKRFKDLDIVLEAMRYHDESTLLQAVEKNTGKNRDEYMAIDVLRTLRRVGEQIAETRGLEPQKPDEPFGTVPEWLLEVVPGYDQDYLYGNKEFRQIVNDFRTVQAILFIADKADIGRRRIDKERNTMDVMGAYEHYRNNAVVKRSWLAWQPHPFERDFQQKFEVVLEFNPVLDPEEYPNFEEVSREREGGGRRIIVPDELAENRTLTNYRVSEYLHWVGEILPMYQHRFFISAALAPIVFPSLETFEVATEQTLEVPPKKIKLGGPKGGTPLQTSSFVFPLTDDDELNATFEEHRERSKALPVRKEPAL